MTNPIPEAMDRIAAMYIDCLAELSVSIDTKDYFYHFQESFPYLTLRVSGASFTDDGSEDYDVDNYNITARLVIGHLTQDYKGELEADLNTWIPHIKTYFHEREGLQHETAATYDETTDLVNLIRARISDTTGYRIFQNAGTNAQQVGVEFTHALEFNETIEPAYN